MIFEQIVSKVEKYVQNNFAILNICLNEIGKWFTYSWKSWTKPAIEAFGQCDQMV